MKQIGLERTQRPALHIGTFKRVASGNNYVRTLAYYRDNLLLTLALNIKSRFNWLVLLGLFSLPVYADKTNVLKLIAREPVTMMDLGILRLNGYLSRQHQPELRGVTMGANYNSHNDSIDIKVSVPINKASRAQCRKIIREIKKLFLHPRDKKNNSNIHLYFQHEGTGYTRYINWDQVASHVIVTAIVLTRKNYHDSVYCESKLMQNKVTY